MKTTNQHIYSTIAIISRLTNATLRQTALHCIKWCSICHIKASFVYWAKEVFVDKSGIIDYDILYCLAKEGAVMNKKFTRIVCIVLASVLVLSLVAMVIPMLVA